MAIKIWQLPVSTINLKWIKAKSCQQLSCHPENRKRSWAGRNQSRHTLAKPPRPGKGKCASSAKINVWNVYSVFHYPLFFLPKASHQMCLANLGFCSTISVGICMWSGSPASCVPLDKWPHLSGSEFCLLKKKKKSWGWQLMIPGLQLLGGVGSSVLDVYCAPALSAVLRNGGTKWRRYSLLKNFQGLQGDVHLEKCVIKVVIRPTEVCAYVRRLAVCQCEFFSVLEL